MSENRVFILLTPLHFADNEVYRGQVPLIIYKMKPVFNHLITFSEGYVPEDQLSIDKSLLFWKGCLGWNVYIPKRQSHFGMESYKLCGAKMGCVWNMLWCTGNEMELKSQIHGIDISHYTKPSKLCLL
jgi:hypothetical protein